MSTYKAWRKYKGCKTFKLLFPSLKSKQITKVSWPDFFIDWNKWKEKKNEKMFLVFWHQIVTKLDILLWFLNNKGIWARVYNQENLISGKRDNFQLLNELKTNPPQKIDFAMFVPGTQEPQNLDHFGITLI